MTLGTLAAAVTFIWLIVLTGLIRLVAAMERTERLTGPSNGPRGHREGRRG